MKIKFEQSLNIFNKFNETISLHKDKFNDIKWNLKKLFVCLETQINIIFFIHNLI